MNNSYVRLNESSIYDTTYSNEDLVEKLGEVDVYDEESNEFKKMKPSELIKVVSDALYKMQRDYPYLYQFLVKCKIMYIPTFPSQITNTMAVDDFNNLWINFKFIYNECKMSSDRAFGILFHEMFHIFFDHCMRFNKKYPKEMFGGVAGAYKKANMKANICMDYEVNASMVDDGIVTSDFFKLMNGMYKKEYTGMTWEEILDKYGDREYKEWLERNGMTLDDIEQKVLEAIEKAAKVLLDPEAEDEEKRYARRELQKTLDELLGKRDKGEKTLQDMFEDLANSKLADTSDMMSLELDEIIDDLHKNPASMSSEELDKTLRDMDKLMDDIADNADKVGEQFGKSAEDVQKDAEKARQSLKDAMKKINEGGLSKEEKEDLLQKAKDDLEDIISDEIEKKKLEEKRKERDEKKSAERLEKFKKNHPFRRMIVVMNNFRDLHELTVADTTSGVTLVKGTDSLISDETYDILGDVVDDLEPLTEKKFSEMKKSDFKSLSKNLDRLKDSFLPDLVALIDNETILNKTKDDMQRLLDGVFEYVFDAFRTSLRSDLDESAKGSVIKMAAQKLRIIGKVLKTQKVWKVGDDFKNAYKDEMKRLMKIYKEEGEEAMFKELLDKGVIDPMYLDEKGRKLWKKFKGESIEIKDGGDDVDYEIYSWRDDEEIEAFKGDIYYEIVSEKYDGEEVIHIWLSPEDDYVSDEYDTYASLAKKFEIDFPEYHLEEAAEAFFDVQSMNEDDVDVETLRKKLEDHGGYKKGKWNEED